VLVQTLNHAQSINFLGLWLWAVWGKTDVHTRKGRNPLDEPVGN